MAHLNLDIFYHIYITGLMLFKPATLFHKINSLPWYQHTLHQWFASLQCRTGSSILEVGCATGQLTEHIGRQGMNVVGVDYSARMLKLSKNSSSRNVRFERANALNLPFEDNLFDHVIAASLLNILSQPELALSEMARVCKPGGKISLLVPLAGMSDQAVTTLASELKLSGFSSAVLSAWHRRAPKMQHAKLLQYFTNAGLHHIESIAYLNGMVLTVTGTIPYAREYYVVQKSDAQI
jgi:ubiquinone/menaquinone biosynthesis C-methylase UbiE